MTSRREARLHLPASPPDASRAAAMHKHVPLVHQLAAQHGITLATDSAVLEWLTQANLPNPLDSSACTAIAVVVQQLYALSAPGGGDGGAG